MTDHRDEVAQLLADYRQSREQLASVHRTLLSITETVTSPDGLIRATVDSAGMLSGLTIAEDAYQRYRPADLAAAVLRATRAAAGRATHRAAEALTPVLPADVDPNSLLSGRGDLRPDEISPPPPAQQPGPAVVPRPVTPRRADDEETYEDVSWMKNASKRG